MKFRIQLLAAFSVLLSATLLSQRPAEDRLERFERMSAERNAGLANDPFVGVTTDGKVRPGLFKIDSSGVSTEPVRKAAEDFLAALTYEQRKKTVFPIEDDEWRKWMNQHFYIRQGVGFNEMSEAQRESAFALMSASLSADGLKLTRDIMRLNHTLGELNDGNFVEYGEWLYWITVMGEPSADQPWGWQLDGHHVIINYFVLGDQVVMTPLFVGSEPVVAESGKYKGIAILQDEQNKGHELINALGESQRDKAVVEVAKTANNNVGEAFRDNVKLDYAGVPVSELSPENQNRVIEIVSMFVGNMNDGHARIRMDEVREHLNETYFAWIGGTGPEDVFYYRIHSPVILVEFDHQRPVGIRHLFPGSRAPVKQHVHAVVRTPNGNDYGKDLLRQHYKRSHAAD